MENMKRVMGIININDSSFYDSSRCFTFREIEERVEQMVKEKADILDFGACSTRPGSTPASEEQEWNGIKLALEVIKEQLKSEDSPCSRLFKSRGQRNALSIDTFRSSIVERAYDFIGEFTINDISAGEDDPRMLSTAGMLKLPYIAMHKRGTPADMQNHCNYENGVTKEVIEYFKRFEFKALEHGIAEYIIDPGFGFAKSVEQNYRLLAELGELKKSLCRPRREGGRNIPLLVGLSRKSMIWRPLEITPQQALSATNALNLQALVNGADILRVHDVAMAVECLKLYRLLYPYLDKD